MPYEVRPERDVGQHPPAAAPHGPAWGEDAWRLVRPPVRVVAPGELRSDVALAALLYRTAAAVAVVTTAALGGRARPFTPPLGVVKDWRWYPTSADPSDDADDVWTRSTDVLLERLYDIPLGPVAGSGPIEESWPEWLGREYPDPESVVRAREAALTRIPPEGRDLFLRDHPRVPPPTEVQLTPGQARALTIAAVPAGGVILTCTGFPDVLVRRAAALAGEDAGPPAASGTDDSDVGGWEEHAATAHDAANGEPTGAWIPTYIPRAPRERPPFIATPAEGMIVLEAATDQHRGSPHGPPYPVAQYPAAQGLARAHRRAERDTDRLACLHETLSYAAGARLRAVYRLRLPAIGAGHSVFDALTAAQAVADGLLATGERV